MLIHEIITFWLPVLLLTVSLYYSVKIYSISKKKHIFVLISFLVLSLFQYTITPYWNQHSAKDPYENYTQTQKEILVKKNTELTEIHLKYAKQLPSVSVEINTVFPLGTLLLTLFVFLWHNSLHTAFNKAIKQMGESSNVE